MITLLAKFIIALYTGIKGGKNYEIPFGTFMNVGTLAKAQIVLTKKSKITRGISRSRLQSFIKCLYHTTGHKSSN